MALAGRTAVVVGAGNGVGPQIVEALLAAGAHVLVEPNPEGAPQGAQIVISEGPGWSRFFDACEKRFGHFEILVHSPPIVQTKPALDLTSGDIRRTIDAELIDVLECMQEAARRMRARGKGRIVTLVSMSGKTGVHKGTAVVAAAKAGVIAFSRSLAAEVAPHGVTVNCIATALFEPQVAHVSAQHKAELTKGIPVGRFGQPIEAAHAVLFLAAEEAGFVTGETLNLSGGRFMD